MRSTFTRKAGVAAGVLSLLALAACGGGGSSSGGGDSTLTIAWTSTPSELDQNLYGGNPDVYLAHAHMGTITTYDLDVPADEIVGLEDIKPGLAESWETSEDGLTYTFKLREGVTSQYGNELTTADVQYTFDRMTSSATTLQASISMPTTNVDPAEPVTVIDDYTFSLNLTAPSAQALSLMAYPNLGILDSTEIAKHTTDADPWAAEWLATNSASFGPYNITSFEPGTEVRLEASDTWYGDEPDYTEIIIRAVPDGSSRAQLLVSGEVDMISEPPIDQFDTIDGASNASLVSNPDVFRHNWTFNTTDPILSDPLVRQALNHAVDREALVESIYQGRAEPALYPQPSTLFDDQPEIGTYDPELAKDLLEQAGYADGFDIQIAFSAERPGPYAENIARLIQSDLSEIGVNVTLNGVASVADFQAGVSKKQYQTFLYTERPSQPDIGFGLYLYLNSKSALNTSGINLPRLDEISVEVLKTAPGPERDALTEEGLQIIADNVPIASLVEMPSFVGLSDTVGGFKPLVSGGFLFDQLTSE
ncbi:ABC transporter substrate-binding protein [Aeromicrobium alkaliterrae]|uniref:ABC transporter substrate-binding protein n=1 Tax=Aeromicrobium alkaliterrae TaxID=302168 RepID=A0ABP4W3E6_9ACTN